MGSQEGCYLSCSVKRNQGWMIRELRAVPLINSHNLLPTFLALRNLTEGGAVPRMKDSTVLWQVYMVMVTWFSCKETYDHWLWWPHIRERGVPNHRVKVNPEIWNIIMMAYGNQVINILTQLWLIMGPLGPWTHPMSFPCPQMYHGKRYTWYLAQSPYRFPHFWNKTNHSGKAKWKFWTL